MNREIHVRLCERLGAKFPGPTRRSAGDRRPYANQINFTHLLRGKSCIPRATGTLFPRFANRRRERGLNDPCDQFLPGLARMDVARELIFW
jgi:hypothetical protein